MAPGRRLIDAALNGRKLDTNSMNLINQILGGLKKRGANAPSGELALPVAHIPKNRIKAALLGGVALGAVCAAGWLAWQWWGARQKAAPPESVAQAPAKLITAPPVESPPVVAPSAASAVEMPQAVAVSQPVAVATQEDLPKQGDHEMGAAALRPRQGLDSPPPANARAKPPATASKPKSSKTASSPVSGKENAEPDDEPGAIPLPDGSVDKQIKPLSVQQQADNEFRRANGLMQQGRINEALEGYETALQLNPAHDAARQAMVVVLLENKRNADAERALQDGLKQNIKHSGFAMLLARIQVERDASWSALLTLQKTLPYAERQADYRAFVAALLQRLNRHKEAVAHYRAAVQLAPDSGVWWMGLGISLQALQRNDEARVAFKRALDSNTLNADLQAFVAQQLKEL